MAVIRVDADSDAGCNGQLAAAHHERRCQRLEKFFCHQSSIIIVRPFDLGKQYYKFISSLAADGVRMA